MPLHIGSWLSGRYTPIHLYGPSGSTPDLGTKAFVDGMKKGYAWDIATRTGALPDAGGQIVVHEFNYLQEKYGSETSIRDDRNGQVKRLYAASHAEE